MVITVEIYKEIRKLRLEGLSQRKIADKLGISRNTVSKAINNADGLADATREKILKKAIEMGYKQFSYVSAVTSVAGSASGAVQQSPGFQGEIALFTTIFVDQSHFASLMLDKYLM